MQPQYDIRWSDEFVADVTAICGDVSIFREAFAGFAFYLARLPRGESTWDLSPTGDLRLAALPAMRLEDGTDVPEIYFTFQLHLGPKPCLLLLHAFRSDDERLAEGNGGIAPPQP